MRVFVELWMPEEMLYTFYEDSWFPVTLDESGLNPRPMTDAADIRASLVTYWTEGNYGCDCNRSIELFGRLHLKRDILPCDDGTKNRILLTLRTADKKDIIFRDRGWSYGKGKL